MHAIHKKIHENLDKLSFFFFFSNLMELKRYRDQAATQRTLFDATSIMLQIALTKGTHFPINKLSTVIQNERNEIHKIRMFEKICKGITRQEDRGLSKINNRKKNSSNSKEIKEILE